MGNNTYKDYYRALGVKRSASDEEIKHAYRSLARMYHPDLHPGDTQAEARLKEINHAYAVLSDPEKREEYDAASTAWRNAPGQAQPVSASDHAGPRKPAPGPGVHVNLSRNRRQGDNSGAAVDLDVAISGLSAGLGIVSGLVGRLDRFLSAAERAASGEWPPSSRPGTKKKQ